MAECASESNGFTFVWKIQNYSMHALSQRDCFLSPIFSTRMLNHSKWRLKLYPHETIKYYPKSAIFLGLEIENVGRISAIVGITFHLITANGLYYIDKITERKFNSNDTLILHFEKDKFNDIFENGSVFSSNNTLTIRCHLWNEDTSVLPSEIRYGLTQFHIEKQFFQWSSRFVIQHDVFYSKKTIIPENKCLPRVEIKLMESKLAVEVDVQFLNEEVYLGKKYRFNIKASVLNKKNELTLIVGWNRLVSSEFNDTFQIAKTELFELRNEFPLNHIFTIQFDIAYSSNEIWSQTQEIDSEIADIKHNFQQESKRYDFDGKKTVKSAQVTKEVSKTDENGIDALINDLSLLLTERKFCDITLKIYQKEFLAHKSILCARSPVFNTMFESNMKEKETGVVNIDDIDSNIFEIFLHYLYQGKINNLSEVNAVSLYSVADKYQVMSLKKESSTFILNHLTEENVCDVLVLSDMHEDEGLKNAAQKIFCIHAKNILLSKDWDTLLMKRPALAGETMRMLAQKL